MAFPHNGTTLPQHFPNLHPYMQQQGSAFNTQRPGGYAIQQPGGYAIQQPGGYAIQQPGGYAIQQPGGYAIQQPPAGARMHPAHFAPTANGPGSFPPGAYKSGMFGGNHPAPANNEALAQEMAADPMFDSDQYVEPYPMTPESAERNDIVDRAKEIRQETRREKKKQNPLATIVVQDFAGKILTGKCAYDIVAVIDPGGDPTRMSDGIFQVQHPNGGLRIAKRLKVNTPERMDRARAERNALLRLKVMESPHINFLYEVSVLHCLILLLGYTNCTLILGVLAERCKVMPSHPGLLRRWQHRELNSQAPA